MAFDDILAQIGEFGLYQKLVYVVILVTWFPAGSNVLSIVFIASPSDHWCATPEWDSANCSGLALSEQECTAYKKFLSIPYDTSSTNGSAVYARCEKYDVTGLAFEDAVERAESGFNGSDWGYDVIPCDSGWIHDRAWSEYTIVQSFDLVCGRKHLINLSQSLFFLGVLLGAFISGAFADRYGRKPTGIVCNVAIVALGVGSAFAPNYVTFAIVRIFLAAACWGLLISVWVIGTEFVGPSWRPFCAVFICMAFSMGYILLSVCAYFIRNWRHLQVAVNGSFAAIIVCLLFIPESVRWQMSMGRFDDAERTVKQVAKINRAKLPEKIFSQEDYETVESSIRQPNAFDLFRTPNLRKRTVVLMLLWVTDSLIYYGLHLDVGKIGANTYITLFITGAVEIAGVALLCAIISHVRRKSCVMFLLATASGASFINIFLLSGIAKTVISMIGMVAINLSWNVSALFVMEVLPTLLRAVGAGVCCTAAYIMAIATPLILMLYDVWPPGPLVLQCLAALVTMFLCWFLPETKGKKLPETLEEGENFGTNKGGRGDFTLLEEVKV